MRRRGQTLGETTRERKKKEEDKGTGEKELFLNRSQRSIHVLLSTFLLPLEQSTAAKTIDIHPLAGKVDKLLLIYDKLHLDHLVLFIVGVSAWLRFTGYIERGNRPFVYVTRVYINIGCQFRSICRKRKARSE